jgi:hypothetical protein
MQLCCPIAYGSMAFWLGRKGIGSDKDHTHKWTGAMFLGSNASFGVALGLYDCDAVAQCLYVARTAKTSRTACVRSCSHCITVSLILKEV